MPNTSHNMELILTVSYNILQYLCDFIHVLIIVTVSNAEKVPN